MEERRVLAFASGLTVNADAFTDYVGGQQYSLSDASVQIDSLASPVTVNITLYQDNGNFDFDEEGSFDDGNQAVLEGGLSQVIFSKSDFDTEGTVYNLGDDPETPDIEPPSFFAPTTPGDYWVVISATSNGQTVHEHFGMPLHVVAGTIDNQPTVGAVSGPTSGIPGQELNYSVAASDDHATTLTYNWSVLRQTTGEPVAAATNTTGNFTFVPPDAGDYVVNVVVSDGVTVPAASSNAAVVNVTSTSLSGGVLSIGANAGGSNFTITRDGSNLVLNGSQTFSGVNKVVVYGQGGDDVVLTSNSVQVPVWIFGGAGNDILSGGGGANVIDGGAGDDMLIGAAGRDLLIGGSGTDIISGGAQDDIVIASALPSGVTQANLDAIMAIWNSTANYQTRISQLRASHLLDGILDDNAVDLLVGGGGNDWFFANLVHDTGDPNDVLDVIIGSTPQERVQYEELKNTL